MKMHEYIRDWGTHKRRNHTFLQSKRQVKYVWLFSNVLLRQMRYRVQSSTIIHRSELKLEGKEDLPREAEALIKILLCGTHLAQ